MAKITLYGNLFPFRYYFIKFKEKRYPKTRKTVVLQLDAALNEKNVCREAYHGKRFVGNHINKMLQVIFLINSSQLSG